MIASHNLHRLTWLALLALVGALVFGLTLRVNAVKHEVRRADFKLAALQREKMYLEVEFETRSNQQQLQNWNDVDFGYVAPGPGQYLGDTRQLASLGRQALPPAPAEDGGQPEVRLAAATIEPAVPLVATTPRKVRAAPKEAAVAASSHPRPVLAGREVAIADTRPVPRVERVALVAAAVVEPRSNGDALP